MKKGIEPAYPFSTIIPNMGGLSEKKIQYKGMSIRLKIASDAMCALIIDTSRYGSSADYAKMALEMADLLIKLEEETRE